MQFVSVKTAAQEMSLSTRQINLMITDGRLTKYKLFGGRTVRVDLDELRALFIPEGNTQ